MSLRNIRIRRNRTLRAALKHSARDLRRVVKDAGGDYENKEQAAHFIADRPHLLAALEEADHGEKTQD